jgi:hypothetical protein
MVQVIGVDVLESFFAMAMMVNYRNSDNSDMMVIYSDYDGDFYKSLY